MAWKKKEKDLTPEEAIQQAKSHLASRWIGLSPLLAVLEEEGRGTLHPLEKSFLTETWIFILFDPLEPESNTYLEAARLWQERYSDFGIKFLLIFTSPFASQFNSEQTLLILQSKGLRAFVTIDIEDQFSRYFGWKSGIQVFLLNQGSTRSLYTGGEELVKTEERLQDFLRESDPGLPLLPIHTGFKHAPGRIERVSFRPSQPASSLKIEWLGKWTPHPQGQLTNDPEASIRVHTTGGSLLLIAKTEREDVALVSRLLVEAAGVPVFDAFSGTDIKSDTDGSTIIELKKLRAYHVTQKLPVNRSPIVLKTIDAERIPVLFMGLRFIPEV